MVFRFLTGCILEDLQQFMTWGIGDVWGSRRRCGKGSFGLRCFCKLETTATDVGKP